MYIGYRYRLYPTADQKVVFAKHFGSARFVFNYALAFKIKLWETEKKNISQFDLCKLFPKLKKEEGTAWLSEVCSHTVQCEMAHLNEAYMNFFRGTGRFPKFKNKRRDRNSYSTNVNISIGCDFIKLPKVGRVRAVISRPIIGRIIKATVSQTATGKYFVSVLCDDGKDPPEAKPFTNSNTIGIDLGLKHFCVLSTGEKVANPRWYQKSLRTLKHRQRILSRKVKGSANQIKQRRIVASIHEKVANRRRDFHHKLSTRIIRESQAVALETLNVSGMQKNARFTQSIADVGWSSFVSMLEYKAERHGKTVLRIGQFEPSSRMCSCGVINHNLKLSDRNWTCKSCNATHDRDILAANNIKRMALSPQSKLIPADSRNFMPKEVLV